MNSPNLYLLLFIIFYFLSSSVISAQNIFPSSGSVGIGTNTPLSKVEVIQPYNPFAMITQTGQRINTNQPRLRLISSSYFLDPFNVNGAFPLLISQGNILEIIKEENTQVLSYQPVPVIPPQIKYFIKVLIIFLLTEEENQSIGRKHIVVFPW